MSLRYEQYHALKRSRKLLREMLRPGFKKFKAQEIRDKAYGCLRHFPTLSENGQPLFSEDEFTVDDYK